jgi:hypothetical protein
MSAKREQVQRKNNADPSRVGETMFVARDPRVSREARFTLGYFISRLQRFDSTRYARHLLIKAVLML